MKPSSPSSFSLYCRWTCPSIYWLSSLPYITHVSGGRCADGDPKRTNRGVKSAKTQSMRVGSSVSYRSLFVCYLFIFPPRLSRARQGPKKRRRRPNPRKKPLQCRAVTEAAERRAECRLILGSERN